LHILANKCPYTDGIAVYQARVLLSEVDELGTEYYNACEIGEDTRNMTSFVNADPMQEQNTVLAVYPNPATDQLTVNYKIDATDIALFEIYNLIGEKVIEKQLNANETVQLLSVAQLNAGAYFYKYSINGIAVKTSKLVIVK
jgi:Secretion system C-terminal sorting domain